MMTTNMNVRLDADLKERLELFAQATGRPASYHVREALLAYLDEKEWLLAKLDEGRRDYEAGRVMDEEESQAFLDHLTKRETLETIAAEAPRPVRPVDGSRRRPTGSEEGGAGAAWPDGD
jgi:predicted transcriptional regulator